jgi:flagellar biosynthesis/type III secretory pathway protein FliH
VRHQFEVDLPTPLSDALLVDPADPLPPLPHSLRVAEAPLPPAPPPPPPAPSPELLWETEIGKQLLLDRKHITTTLTRLGEVLRSLEEQQQRRLLEWQQAAVELGVALAARLLHQRIEVGEMALETVVREAVGRLAPDEPLRVRLHPQDLALLRKRLDGEPLLPEGLSVQVIGDPTLGRGDCHVEGREGAVISEVRTQLADLRSDLLGKLSHAGSEI